ncbi:MAG: PASTA domain-containing protein [Actinomycetota bacterium]|jgi:hypothetical protein|nr:PASTA domain-containing protein [Actinomycetota bacterium]
MTLSEMDPVFASALRGALVAHVEGTARRRRRWHWKLGAGVLAGSSVLAGGVAVAATLLSQPGGTVTTPLGTAVTVTRTGTATVDLGSPPRGANGVSITLTCLSAGTYVFPGGASSTCTKGSQTGLVEPLGAGETSVTITSKPTNSWKLRAVFVQQVTTQWAVNAKGETYGVPNQNGTPDLQAVPLSAGIPGGYVESKALNCADGGDVSNPAQAVAWDTFSKKTKTLLPVYTRNGSTILGSYVVGGSGPGVRVVPLSTVAEKFCQTTRTRVAPSTGVAIPNVEGEPEGTAAGSLRALGLEAQVTEQPSSVVPQGEVITQSPVAGAEVPNGSSVHLTVSTGQPTDSIREQSTASPTTQPP